MPMLIMNESSEDNIFCEIFYFLFHFILFSSWEFFILFLPLHPAGALTDNDVDDDAMWKNKRFYLDEIIRAISDQLKKKGF